MLLICSTAIVLFLCGCTLSKLESTPAIPEPTDRNSFIEQIDKNPKPTEEYNKYKKIYEIEANAAAAHPGIFDEITMKYNDRLEWINSQSLMVKIKCSEMEAAKAELDMIIDQPKDLPELEDIENPIKNRTLNVGVQGEESK